MMLRPAALLRSPLSVQARPDPAGLLLLLGVYVALLAGRFTLPVSGVLEDLDLRFVFVYGLALGVAAWSTTWRGTQQVAGSAGVGPGSRWFAAWCGLLALASFWASPGARVGSALVDVFFLLVFAVAAWTIASRLTSAQLTRVWLWLIVTAAVYLVLALYVGPGAQNRYSAPGGGPNVFVRVMIVGALAALCRYRTSGRMWWLAFIPFFAVGALLSGSRGGLLSAAIVFLLAGIPVFRSLGLRWAVLCLLTVPLTTVAVLEVLSRGTAVFQFLRDRYLTQTLTARYGSGRDTIAEQALAVFSRHPWLGAGLDGYYASQSVGPRFEYPHNLVLATLAETGLVGGTLLAAALIAFGVSASRARPVPDNALFFLIAGVYLFFASMFSGDYYDSRMMWFFLGLAAVEGRRHRRGTRRAPAAGGLAAPTNRLPPSA